METFGLYYPANPGARPFWRPSLRSLRLLIGTVPSYSAWRLELSRIGRRGPHEWWGRRWPGIDLEGAVTRQIQTDLPYTEAHADS